MSELAYIDDGYTAETTIPAASGIHPAVKITYRPALAEERYQILRVTDVDGKEHVGRLAKLVKRHLEAWNVKDRKGNVVPIEESFIRRVQPALLGKITDIILGFSATAEEAEDAKN